MGVPHLSSRRLVVMRPLVAGGALLFGIASSASAQLIINGGFENAPPSGFGDHVNYPVAPWQLVGSGQSNVVKVDHGTHPYGSGPNADATGLAGVRHYLDIANAGNGIYQTFTPACSGTITFSGYFSSRVYQGKPQSGSGTISIRQNGINGSVIAQATVTNLQDGVNWTMRSASAAVTANTTYAFAVTMDNNLNFDEASATYNQSCAGNGGGVNTGDPVDVIHNPAVPHAIEQPDPCCPPWNKVALQNSLAYQGTSIAAPYTLHWQPAANLDAQMQAYVAYLHALDPSYTSITVAFGLFPAGTGATPGSPGVQIGASVLMTWTWNGNGPSGPTNWFPPNAMNVGTWYTVASSVFLNDGLTFFPDTCSNVSMAVRLQVAAGATAPGSGRTGRAPQLEVRPAPGGARLPVPPRSGPPRRP